MRIWQKYQETMKLENIAELLVHMQWTKATWQQLMQNIHMNSLAHNLKVNTDNIVLYIYYSKILTYLNMRYEGSALR